jgi:hypothetical protein
MQLILKSSVDPSVSDAKAQVLAPWQNVTAAGLVRWDAGQVWVGGSVVTDVSNEPLSFIFSVCKATPLSKLKATLYLETSTTTSACQSVTSLFENADTKNSHIYPFFV